MFLRGVKGLILSKLRGESWRICLGFKREDGETQICVTP